MSHRLRITVTALIILAVAALLYFYSDKAALKEAFGGLSAQDIALDTSALSSDIPQPSPMPEGEYLDIYFFDVGQGDSILLKAPSGSTMLIDAGDAEHVIKLASCLKKTGVERIDALVATHPHTDHIGGMRRIIENYEIGAFYMPDAEHTTSAYEGMIAALYDKGIESNILCADNGTLINWDDDVKVEVLSPFADTDFADLNDQSVILRVSYGGRALLLAGDAGPEEEQLALNLLGENAFRADILKVPHHGSDWGSPDSFINAVSPRVAVISCAINNDYGHPEAGVLEKLADCGASVYRTDKFGTVRILVSANGSITIAAEKAPTEE